MTLIVALKSKNGIVLAGDKRNFHGGRSSTFDDNATKVFKLNDKVAIGGAGNGYDSKSIIDDLLTDPSINNKDVTGIKDILSIKARNKQAIWYTPQNIALMRLKVVSAPEFGFLLVGYTHNGKSKIYNFTSNDSVPHEEIYNHHPLGITDVAKYLFLENYKENFKIDDLVNLAKLTIEATNKISSAVSKNIDLIKITPEE